MIQPADRKMLRDLARRVADAADLPIMAQRRELWKQHNALRPTRPMILVFPEGAWAELLPESALICQPEARRYEWALRARLYTHEHFADDTVVEKHWDVHQVLRHSSWGLEIRRIASPTARGAWHFDPVIRVPTDLKKLRVPEVSIDEQATRQALAEAQDLFGDILDVQLKGITHHSFHLMSHYTALRGLEEVMLDMIDNPAWLHDAMAFLTQAYQNIFQQYRGLNLLSRNNDGTYHSSGGVGYTDELAAHADAAAGAVVQPSDMWCSSESQELAQVSPEMHREFALHYEKQLLAPFGLNGYGCCEDLSRKLDDVLTIPHIRRISMSPFADVDVAAPQLKDRRAIFSWKPHPSHLVGKFDEERIGRYIQHTVDVCRHNHCALEVILKDTHTCENQPERFDRWTRIARKIVDGGE